MAAALQITVRHGHLRRVSEPLLIGHYAASRLTGTEALVDALIGGAMAASLAAGLYPEAPGTHQRFANRRGGWRSADAAEPARPAEAVVVGLGDEGQLRLPALIDSVTQAVIGCAQRRREAAEDVYDAKDAESAPFTLAATLLGSGGLGMSAGTAAQAIALGVRAANRRLAALPGRPVGGRSGAWPTVAQLVLVELYLDRATEAWQGVQAVIESDPAGWALAPQIELAPGGLARPAQRSYRGAAYDCITVTTGWVAADAATGAPDDAVPAEALGLAGALGLTEASAAATAAAAEPGRVALSYTLDTPRARAEVHARRAQSRLLRALIEAASDDRAHDPRLGRALFQLLVPAEIQAFLGNASDSARANDLLITLDDASAGIPWELLDTRRGGIGAEADSDADADVDADAAHIPWAIRTRLLRRLRSDAGASASPRQARSDADILVIGAPALEDDAGYPPLPGARHEAQAVLAALSGPRGLDAARVRGLVEQGAQEDAQEEAEKDAVAEPPATGRRRRKTAPAPEAAGPEPRPAPGAQEVITTLLERDWRIVHLAGHGDPGTARAPGGLVLSGGQRLGAAEFGAMARVPELVFVNACHLGRAVDAVLRPDAMNGVTALNNGRARDWPAWAASLARGLIGQGVRCVIAAGWAVDDAPAAAFATRFYAELLAGQRFIDAVGAARAACWRAHPTSQTWAAYQCYGDPDWVWRRDAADAQQADAALSTSPAASAPSTVLADIVSPTGLLLAVDRLLQERRLRWLDRHLEPQPDAAARRAERDRLRAELDALAVAFGPIWGERGDVAEALGRGYAALAVERDADAGADANADAHADADADEVDGRAAPASAQLTADDDDRAIAWLSLAVAAPDALASLRAVQQLALAQARQALGGAAAALAAVRAAAGRPRRSAKTRRAQAEAVDAALAPLAAAGDRLRALLAQQPGAPFAATLVQIAQRHAELAAWRAAPLQSARAVRAARLSRPSRPSRAGRRHG